MKRFFCALLAALSLLSLTACGKTPEERPEPDTTLPPEIEEPVQKPEPESPPADSAAEIVNELLSSMSLAEKVGQLFFVRCPADHAVEDISAYHLGGYILFGRDFQDATGSWLTKEQFTQTIQSYQDAASISLLIGTDEEGGTVARASRNPNLFPDGKCKSPQALYLSDGWDGLATDTVEKTARLMELGINVNLAPVCDVSTDPNDFIYDRSFGQDAERTAEYVKCVVSWVSWDRTIEGNHPGLVLKHFPGYGNNADTHTGIAVDERPMETFKTSDFLPFQAGIEADSIGTVAVLVSHNIVQCMDPELPASLSPAVHEILRRDLDFDGVVMTDDLAMDAVSAYAKDGAAAVMALEAGNDLVITTDYRTQIPKVIEAVETGVLAEDMIDAACRRVLTWKYHLGLLVDFS